MDSKCGICEKSYHIECRKELLLCNHTLCNECMNKIVCKLGNSCPFCRGKMIEDRTYIVRVVANGIEFELKIPESEFLKNNIKYIPDDYRPTNELDEEYRNRLRRAIGIMEETHEKLKNALYEGPSALVQEKSIEIKQDLFPEYIKNELTKITIDKKEYTLKKYKTNSGENLFCRELNDIGFCGAIKSDKKATCAMKRKEKNFCVHHS